jgi:TP901 family phage tail tape measure protein
MAENKSQGAQHLTSLDLDISGIQESLEKAKEQIEQYSIESGKAWKEGFKSGTSGDSGSDSGAGGVGAEFDNATQAVETFGNTVKSTVTVVNGEIKKLQSVQDVGGFEKVTTTLQVMKDGSTQTTQSITRDSAARQKAYESEVESVKELATKYETLAAKATTKGNTSVATQATASATALRALVSEIESSGTVTDEQRAKIEQYSNEIGNLKAQFEAGGVASQSFIKTITDKAKWLAAFTIVNQLRQAFTESISTIKETEDAVVELQRVLTTEVESNVISDELYQIAYDYGRTFDDVSEVSTKFAQAGYEWNDVVELTRGTMLALNTAELDVTQSTEGLIAIMQQWGYTADDYADVIDKINITADNFPITSEKIVAALQRVSGTANNANISFEQTVGLITALGEATGRSGENIGTALNSLIAFTSKDSALKTFGQLDGMDEIIAKYKAGAASIYDVWYELSDKIQNLTEEQNALLFNTEEYEDFANDIEQNATEITEQIQSVYKSAGTYRQNYLIAILKDLASEDSTAQQVIENITNYLGYSESENAKYMETLTADINQLKVKLAELAVQLGEAGFLDLLKTLTNLGIKLADLAQEMGGIIPLLTTIGGLIVSIKAQEISKNISNFITKITLIPTRLGLVNTSTATTAANLSQVTAAAEGAEVALTGVSTSATAAATSFSALEVATGWIGAIVTALGLLYSAFGYVDSKIEESKQAQLSNADAYKTEADSIKSLKEEYEKIVDSTDDAATKTEKLTEYKKKLIEAYGDEATAIAQLNGERKDEIDFLDEEYAKNIRSAYLEIKDQYAEAVNAMENAGGKIYTNFTYDGQAVTMNEKDVETLSQYLKLTEEINSATGETQQYFDYGTTNLQEQVDLLADILTNAELTESTEAKIQAIYDSKKATLDANSDIYKKYAETVAMNYLLLDDTQKKIAEINDEENSYNRKALYDDLVESLENSGMGAAALSAAMEVLNAEFPEYATQTETATENTDDLSTSTASYASQLTDVQDAITETNKTIDSFQKSLDAVYGVWTEYNSTGYVTVDMLQTLISAGSDYASIIDIENGKLSLNKTRLNELLESQEDNLEALAAQNFAADLLNVTNEYLGTSTAKVGTESENSVPKIDGLSDSMNDYAIAAANGNFQTLEFIDSQLALRGMGGDEIDMSGYINAVNEVYERYQNTIETIQGLSGSINAWSTAAQKADKAAAKSAKQEAKEEQSAAKDALNAKKDAINNEIKAIKEVTSARKEELKQQESDLKDSVSKQKELLEKQKTAVKDRYDAEIQAIKDTQSADERYEKYQEYLKNKRDAEKSIAKAASRSGVEYREQEAEARENLEEINENWEQQVSDWAQEDMISFLETLRDEETKSIENQIDAIEKARDASLEDLDAKIDALESKQTEVLAEKQKDIEKVEQDIETISDTSNSKYAETLERIKTELSEYYDGAYDAYSETLERIEKTYGQEVLDPIIENTQAAIVQAFESAPETTEQMKTLYNNYDTEYLQPVIAETPEMFEDMFTSIAESSKEKFSEMRQYFEENFYDKVKEQLTELQALTYNLQASTASLPTSSSYNTTNSTTYNSNQSVVLNNSIYGTQSANSVNKSFFTLP